MLVGCPTPKMTPNKLSLSDFLLSLKLSPRLVVELIVQNSEGSLFLLKRESDPYIGTWHLPGGFLLKGELLADCIDRLIKEELGVEPVSWEYLQLIEDIDGDPRGHLLHYFVKLTKVVAPTTNGQYFNKIPNNVMPFQLPMLRKLGYK